MLTTTTPPTPSPFPAPTKTASATIAQTPTTASTLHFSDKILITISQHGKLNHWLHVPLLSSSPLDPSSTQQQPTDLLPLPHLTATTVLGGTRAEAETLGQLYATSVA
ncbi:hypothetical protein LTR28_003096, partial [Elasticomyces elasticus]